MHNCTVHFSQQETIFNFQKFVCLTAPVINTSKSKNETKCRSPRHLKALQNSMKVPQFAGYYCVCSLLYCVFLAWKMESLVSLRTTSFKPEQVNCREWLFQSSAFQQIFQLVWKALFLVPLNPFLGMMWSSNSMHFTSMQCNLMQIKY